MAATEISKRRFVTWTKETVDAELAELLAGYGTSISNQFLVNTYRSRFDLARLVSSDRFNPEEQP
ncbi:hypothetical protein [Burkholderia arboris]|uniref:hypothetical protein n=1 Tax=Burkholderia arboris TaxID=488730 RepID=UPI001CF3A214|nr:hypothetical protein [Burkholderia arboris]MCA8052815.1 hypothetical protein [Burkholderia arboris]